MFSFASSGQILSGLSKQFFYFVFCSAHCFSFCLINYNSFEKLMDLSKLSMFVLP